MKNRLIFSLSILTAMVLGSCATSNEVSNGGLMQKRKYNKGIYWNKIEKAPTAKNDKDELDIFKREEKSSKKYVSSNTLYAEAENNEFEESVDLASVDNSTIESTTNDSEKALISSKPVNPVLPVDDKEKESAIKIKKDKFNFTKSNEKSSNHSTDSMFILIVILTIIFPPLGVAVFTNIDWMKVLICFLLTLLFYIPGLIYGLLVIFGKI